MLSNVAYHHQIDGFFFFILFRFLIYSENILILWRGSMNFWSVVKKLVNHCTFSVGRIVCFKSEFNSD